MTNKNLLIAGGVLLAVGGIGYLYRNEIMNLFIKKDDIIPIDPEDSIIPNNNTDPITPPVKVLPSVKEIDKKLKKGDKNNNVKQLQFNIREIQKMLKTTPLTADGDFGKITDGVLLKISDFYKKNNYWTIRKARETVARYAGKFGLEFPVYLLNVENNQDLQKIYQGAKVKGVIDSKIR
jgi:hypothetical protein